MGLHAEKVHGLNFLWNYTLRGNIINKIILAVYLYPLFLYFVALDVECIWTKASAN